MSHFVPIKVAIECIVGMAWSWTPHDRHSVFASWHCGDGLVERGGAVSNFDQSIQSCRSSYYTIGSNPTRSAQTCHPQRHSDLLSHLRQRLECSASFLHFLRLPLPLCCSLSASFSRCASNLQNSSSSAHQQHSVASSDNTVGAGEFWPVERSGTVSLSFLCQLHECGGKQPTE